MRSQLAWPWLCGELSLAASSRRSCCNIQLPNTPQSGSHSSLQQQVPAMASAATAPGRLSSIFDVAQAAEAAAAASSPGAAALRRMFSIRRHTSSCTVGPELAAKYGVERDNQQLLVSVTNKHTLEQAWFNRARTRKPQTFSAAPASAGADPTRGGGAAACDFCGWRSLTACDTGFGRVELTHAVTSSNLFKYCAPGHGLVLFKHHDPLAFTLPQLADLLDAAWLWFGASAAEAEADGDAGGLSPFLLWNCLARAGASQYHGHAQVLLTEEPQPAAIRLAQAAAGYAQQHAGRCYYSDLVAAHASVGLARQISVPAAAGAAAAAVAQHHTAWAFASLAPIKDAEVNVVGQHLCCPAFHAALHVSLRALIDGCGCSTFNVGVLNIDLQAQPPAGVGADRQHWHSSGCGDESSSNSSDTRLAALDGGSGNGSGSSSSSRSSSSGASMSTGSSSGSLSGSGEAVQLPGPNHWGGRPPVIARIVSRGKLTAAASDFGGLEVFGGASIGHTDPFELVQQLDAQLARAAE